MMDDGRICCTTTQLRRIQSVAFVVAAGVAVVFCLCFALLGFAAGRDTGISELEHRVNPNDAPPESLVRLPGVGLARAQAIVAYRQQFRQSGKGDLAFRNCNDLRNVKGIGPVTARDMCEYLRFQ
jgi:competence ComEA-like helix-hairpin-helix protein